MSLRADLQMSDVHVHDRLERLHDSVAPHSRSGARGPLQFNGRADADIDYLFAQVDVDRDIVGYDGNCGNISSAVGPFAIDEGLVAAAVPVTSVRIHNVNTGKMLVAKVQVSGGKARVFGDCAIPGVPGTGAEILMDYTDTVGAKTGKLLPTGRVTDWIALEDRRRVEVTICDVANPCVFIDARSLGLSGSELPNEIGANVELIEAIGEIQGKAGELAGFWSDWREHHLPGLPLAVLVAAPGNFSDVNGVVVEADAMDLRARLIFLGKCHDSMAGTGSMCTAAASRLLGSVVNQVMDEDRARSGTLRIGHPLGVMEVKVIAEAGAGSQVHFSALGLTRTARRLMTGSVYVPCHQER
jgi:2-methylaconitate cis-trans-isomerase PrpF